MNDQPPSPGRMPAEGIFQRLAWNGVPSDLGELFHLVKNNLPARAVLRTHQFGWELLVFVGQQQEALWRRVCQSREEVISTGEQWKASMLANGWD